MWVINAPKQLTKNIYIYTIKHEFCAKSLSCSENKNVFYMINKNQMEVRDARRASRHLQRAHELLNPHGFGFGGPKDDDDSIGPHRRQGPQRPVPYATPKDVSEHNSPSVRDRPLISSPYIILLTSLSEEECRTWLRKIFRTDLDEMSQRSDPESQKLVPLMKEIDINVQITSFVQEGKSVHLYCTLNADNNGNFTEIINYIWKTGFHAWKEWNWKTMGPPPIPDEIILCLSLNQSKVNSEDEFWICRWRKRDFFVKTLFKWNELRPLIELKRSDSASQKKWSDH